MIAINDIHVVNPEMNSKSKLKFENITIYFDKNFNWFQRLMLKLVFGLNVEKIK